MKVTWLGREFEDEEIEVLFNISLPKKRVEYHQEISKIN